MALETSKDCDVKKKLLVLLIAASSLLMPNLASAIAIDGGENVGLPCMGLAYHGFNKVEDQVVSAAAKFILAN